MKKIGIVTLTGYFNYGNRLQNYALSHVLEKYNFEVYTIWNDSFLETIKIKVKTSIFFKRKYSRLINFYEFTRKYIKITYPKFQKRKFDYVVVGSDQVWNIRYIQENPMLLYSASGNEKVFSYAASIGYDSIPTESKAVFRSTLDTYEGISVREQSAKTLIEEIVDKEVKEVLDPTLLLSQKEWEAVSIKPQKMINKRYVLVYFLGDLDKSYQKSIEEFVAENSFEAVYLNKNDDIFNSSGPGEFIYLIENSEVVLTDSFHACVFSFIFNRPFIVFQRKGCSDHMYSRITNLLSTFQLQGREYKSKITNDDLAIDYNTSKEILQIKKNESLRFIESILLNNK